MKRHFILLLLMAFGLGSCTAIQTSSDRLKEAISYFNEGVRWGRLQEVLSRIDPNTEEHFLEMHKEFGKEIQLTSCEIVSVKINEKEKKATVGVLIVWYRLSEMVVHETSLIQLWEEKERNWIMMAEEYRSGTPF